MSLSLNRDCQPRSAIRVLYLIPVDKTILLVLDCVEEHEHISARNLVKISNPGKISRLVYAQYHLIPLASEVIEELTSSCILASALSAAHSLIA